MTFGRCSSATDSILSVSACAAIKQYDVCCCRASCRTLNGISISEHNFVGSIYIQSTKKDGYICKNLTCPDPEL